MKAAIDAMRKLMVALAETGSTAVTFSKCRPGRRSLPSPPVRRQWHSELRGGGRAPGEKREQAQTKYAKCKSARQDGGKGSV